MAGPTQVQKLNDLERRVDSVAAEMRFNENIILRNETLLSELAEVSYQLKARQDVFDERMTQMMSALQHNHEDIEALRREQIKSHTEVMNQIRTLEQWKWYVVGAIAIVAFIAPMVIEMLYH